MKITCPEAYFWQNCKQKNELHYECCLIGLCTFSELQNRPQQFGNLMFIMLVKVYYSSFSAFTASTFDWLIGRSWVKSFYQHRLLSSAISNKDSVDTGAKHRNHSVKVHSEKYSAWYMKYWKYNISLLMPK